ncbi:MAG: PLP-dependent aminotransferase family protein [Trueperaceae bacterium]|jgi:2-aminoadipate transaminase|nr:PLP-dependent aminotransferase family protein [Trueperaceae bacterium]HRQ10497.1 PLP-dependent aminotransferase family protein [Trueperaceae bacterium]
MSDPFDQRLSTRVKGVTSSAIREILKVANQPDIISFAGGLPAPDYFPIEAMRVAADRVLSQRGRSALQYGATEGVPELRELIAERATEQEPQAPVGPENVILTTGSQQALDLVSKVLLDPGDLMITEDPTYLGALQAFRLFQATYHTVAMDDEGALPDALREGLEQSPKFAYLLPTFQNPTGRTMGRRRREAVAELFREYQVPLVEDEPYSALYFDGPAGPSLRSLAPDLTLALGTFSKTLAPGLRLGWVIGPAAWVARLAQVKQSADLHTSTLSQHVALEVLTSGALEPHLDVLRGVYQERCQAMLEALAEHFPKGSRWTVPTGGMFVWVELPEGVDVAPLLPRVVAEEKVAYVPGAPFHPNGGGLNTMRLNFTHAPTDVVRDGVARLGRALARALDAAPA